MEDLASRICVDSADQEALGIATIDKILFVTAA